MDHCELKNNSCLAVAGEKVAGVNCDDYEACKIHSSWSMFTCVIALFIWNIPLNLERFIYVLELLA